MTAPSPTTDARPLTATCRLQVHKEFRLEQVRAIVGYLHRLGVSHVYTSPVLAARPGSTHGYDVADPTRLNPELGTEDDRRALAEELARHGMGWLLDIVPNHMGTGPTNPFWEDVLTHGRASRYAHWFDIDWEPPDERLRERVLLPVLGDWLPNVIGRDEIAVVLEQGRFRVQYFDNTFPVDPASLPELVAWREPHPGDAGIAGWAELRELLDSIAEPPDAGDPRERAAAILRRVAELCERTPALGEHVGGLLREFSAGDDGRRRLRAFLDAQAYSIVFWRRAAKEINYRRFFDINELVALRMEDPAVFAETHALVLDWVARGEVTGLRIDHIDGLLDPLGYLERLRGRVREARPGLTPIVVEKILSPGERLRAEWPVQGTTGYEVLNDIEALFIDPAGAEAVEAGYRRFLKMREQAPRSA